MTQKNIEKLPDYLKELLSPTSINREKIIAVWDGLSYDNQIILLSEIDDIYTSPYFEDINRLSGGERLTEIPDKDSLNRKLWLKALESDNDFIRFLASKKLYEYIPIDELSEDDKKVNGKIDKDPSNLVKYTKYINPFYFPNNFFDLSLDARLIIVANSTAHNGLSDVIKKAISEEFFVSTSAEKELNQILWEFVNHPEYQKGYEDSLVWTSPAFKELWRLIPELPESSGSILVEKLLHSGSGDIPKGLINKFTLKQIGILFERKDIEMPEERKEFFFKDINKNNEIYLSSYCLYNTALTDDEFTKVINTPSNEKYKRLKALAVANDLYLYHYYFIIVLLRENDEDDHTQVLDDSYWESEPSLRITMALDEIYEEIREEAYNDIFDGLYKLRLANLVVKSMKWKSEDDVPEELSRYNTALFNKRVKKDYWQTYLAFFDELKLKVLFYYDFPKIPVYESDYDYDYFSMAKSSPSTAKQIRIAINSITEKSDNNTYRIEKELGKLTEETKTKFSYLIIALFIVIIITWGN